MKRFIDLRGQGTGCCFAWWDTVRDEFESFSGDQAWDTWSDFVEVCPPEKQERYKRLCPLWVFEPHLADDVASYAARQRSKKMDTKSASLLVRVGLLRQVDDPWLNEVMSFLDKIPSENKFAESLVRHLSNPINNDLRMKLHCIHIENLERMAIRDRN